ncbi:MAG: outer membrane lipoprotein carrier protein LolA [Chitinophagales bacterium]
MKTTESFIITCCILLISLVGRAQTFTPVKDETVLRKKITEASQRINTIQCDFTQEKNLSMLSEKAVSKGRFYFKKESTVRLEYLTPAKNLIVMNNGKLFMKDDKKTTQMDMHRNRAFQQLNNIIVGSINGNLFNGKDFSARFYEADKQVKIELRPLSKTLKGFLSTIVIVLEKKDFTANRIEMNETSGDYTILSFNTKEINGPVDDALFLIK